MSLSDSSTRRATLMMPQRACSLSGPSTSAVQQMPVLWRQVTNVVILMIFPINFVVMKPSRTRWAGHVACLVEKGNAYRSISRKLKGPTCKEVVKMALH